MIGGLRVRLGAAVGLPVFVMAVLALGVTAQVRSMSFLVERADKSQAQAALMSDLLAGLDDALLAATLGIDVAAATAALDEFEHDAMHMLGKLDQLTEQEIAFVTADERPEEERERERPAALRVHVLEALEGTRALVRLRMSADFGVDATDRLAVVLSARTALSALIDDALEDELDEIATARADHAAAAAQLATGAVVALCFAGLGAAVLGAPPLIALRRRIESLRRTLDRLTADELHHPANERRTDELSRLFVGVDALAAALDRRRTEAVAAHADLAARLERRGAELELSNARLREVDATRCRFIGDIGHALKTPVAVARGNVENAQTALTRDNQTHDPARMLDQALAALDGVTDRLTALMALARAEDGRLVRDMAEMDLFDLLDRRLAALRVLPGGGRLRLTTSTKCPAIVRADGRELEKMLDAVLENALEHAPGDGAVTVDLAATETQAVVRVIDTGPGLPQDGAEAAFARYHSTRPDGTGIGLAMARQIVEEHGGNMLLERAATGGACAVIRLPLTAPVSPRTQPPQEEYAS